MKQFLSFLVSGALLSSFILPTFAVSQYSASAEALVNAWVINRQNSESGYRFGDSITRAEAVKIALKNSGKATAVCTGKVFSDVSSSLGDLCGYIEAAAAAGIISKNNATFRPNDNITRAEVIKMLLAAKWTKVSTVSAGFSDVSPSLGDLQGYINAAAATGVIPKGGAFRPTSLATRGEVFAFARPQTAAATSPQPTAAKDPHPNLKLNVATPYVAPELAKIQAWINSDPLTMASLKWKVVIVDFWTYSCINCVRTTPYLNAWHDKYASQGLVILGIHSPEFAFEKVTANVQKAVIDAKIKYPVALDNSFGTWSAYRNRYWPAKYFVDKTGKVRHTHFGEGKYEESEQVIQKLLAEGGSTVATGTVKVSTGLGAAAGQSHETYLGYARLEKFANLWAKKNDILTSYILASSLTADQWTLGGKWTIEEEAAISGENGAKLQMKISAKEVYLVMSSTTGGSVKVRLNGQLVKPGVNAGIDVRSDGSISVKADRMYRLVKLPSFAKDQLLELEFDSGVSAYAFTFGG